MNFIFLLIILLLIYIGYKKIKKLNINTNIGKTTAILFGIWLYLMSLYGEEYLFAPFNAWLKSMGVDPDGTSIKKCSEVRNEEAWMDNK